MAAIPAHLREQLETAIRELSLESVADQIVAAGRECFYLHLGKQDDGKRIGASRVGGAPDLPTGLDWPHGKKGYLNFIAQVNLCELPVDSTNDLPHGGMLYLFIESDEQCLNVSHKLIYSDLPAAKLRRVRLPTGSGMAHESYNNLIPHYLTVVHGIELPTYGSKLYDYVEENAPTVDGKTGGDRYSALQDLLSGQEEDLELIAGKLLGYCSEIQGNLRRDAALISIGKRNLVYETHRSVADIDQDIGEASEKGDEATAEFWKQVQKNLAWYHEHRIEFDSLVETWRMLWQIESNFKVGLCIWDAGTYNLLIQE